MRTQTGQAVKLADYEPTPYAVTHVDLSIDVAGEGLPQIVATVGYERRADTPAGTPLVLDGDELRLEAARLDGADLPPAAYEATPDAFTLHQPPAGPFTLQLTTRVDAAGNTQLSGLYLSNGVYCTQCEAEGFRRITYFLDRPDVLATYDVTLRCDPAATTALSNGNLISDAVEGGIRIARWHDPHPKPSYLFAAIVGTLEAHRDTFTTMSGREVALAIWVQPGKAPMAAYAMDALIRSMRWDEERFGREYDLDIFNIVAVPDFNMGAMENKGLNVFNDKYVLADPDLATDTDYANIEAIVAHEYFHNWTGNRITCRDWFQLCLKEGLTVYRDQEFSADMRSATVERIAQVARLKAAQFPEDDGPLAHPVRPAAYEEINNFYTATVYQKGAELVRMLETLVGRDGFRDALDLYFERHDGEACTVEQFLACFRDACGFRPDAFMRWYEQAGTPVVEARREGTGVRLVQSWKPIPATQTNGPVPIPVRVGVLGGGDGDEEVLLLADVEQWFDLGLDDQARVSLLRDFSAPVRLEFAESEDDLAVRARDDDNLFNRWDAMQRLARGLLLNAYRDGAGTAACGQWAEAVAGAVFDDALEADYRAHCLAVPSENALALDIAADVDPERVRTLRASLNVSLARHLDGRALDMVHAIAPQGAYDPAAGPAGERRLRNALLMLLAENGVDDAVRSAERQFETADNMTDRFGALAALAHQQDAGLAERALDAFHARYAGEPLVVDKWLALQATLPGENALDRIETLMRHSSFTMENPNRVRSLLGTFAASNPTGFHRADGAAYAMFAQRIVELDRRNRQVAARVLTSMRTWRLYDAPRRDAARAALEAIAAEPSLSRDTAEIVKKILT